MDESESVAVPEQPADASAGSWQEKRLPLMTWILVGLTVFFVGVTLFQAYDMQRRIGNFAHEAIRLPADATGSDTARWRDRVSLEAYAMQHRYQHSSLILMSRAWIIYLGFLTGMIMAMVGAAFILGKIQESESQLAAKGAAGELSFKSSSPGLVMGVLGTVLMICTMVIRADVTVTDAPVFLTPEVRVSEETPAIPEPGSLSGKGGPAKRELDDSILDSAPVPGKKPTAKGSEK